MTHNSRTKGWSALRSSLASRPPVRVPRSAADREAAVALILRCSEPHGEVELLMIKRAEREADPWSGHMALPGGRRDASDASLEMTALRETREEVGLVIEHDDVLGELDDVHPRSTRTPSIIVSPFVATVAYDAQLHPDVREVEAALWVPLSALRDPAAVSELVLEMGGFKRNFPSIVYGEYTIWGLTHRILSQFLEVVYDVGI